MSPRLLFAFAFSLTACATESDGDGETDPTDDGGGEILEDSGLVEATALPVRGAWEATGFDKPVEDCGFEDLGLNPESLIPAYYNVGDIDEESRTFVISSKDQESGTTCVVEPDGAFACESLRTNYLTDMGDQAEFELGWEGVASETELRGDVDIGVLCEVASVCDYLENAAGLSFPCTITGTLVIEAD